MPDTVFKCEVCDQHPSIGVAASRLGPFSCGFCRECLQMQAEPEWVFDYVFTDIGPDDVADHVTKLTTYRNGGYVTWNAYVQLRREHPEQFTNA